MGLGTLEAAGEGMTPPKGGIAWGEKGTTAANETLSHHRALSWASLTRSTKLCRCPRHDDIAGLADTTEAAGQEPSGN